ncbi:hypothetical protein HAX54_034108 [Datura stramonium]|uniref:Uncharacterized protein n=1 Tax=Datura stramonium TaxID=4076 RepID=A0ABS8VFN4_DATST|nr:hypothetical protein [Datura stramonium]
MDSNGPPTKRLVELNRHSIQDGQNGVRDGVTGDGQGLSEEDESRINEDVEGGNETQRDLVQVQAVLQTQQQQQPPGPLVRWERFLPLRSLKVLLVENDDSTRHVVSALLRNCSYEGYVSLELSVKDRSLVFEWFSVLNPGEVDNTPWLVASLIVPNAWMAPRSWSHQLTSGASYQMKPKVPLSTRSLLALLANAMPPVLCRAQCVDPDAEDKDASPQVLPLD